MGCCISGSSGFFTWPYGHRQRSSTHERLASRPAQNPCKALDVPPADIWRTCGSVFGVRCSVLGVFDETGQDGELNQCRVSVNNCDCAANESSEKYYGLR